MVQCAEHWTDLYWHSLPVFWHASRKSRLYGAAANDSSSERSPHGLFEYSSFDVFTCFSKKPVILAQSYSAHKYKKQSAMSCAACFQGSVRSGTPTGRVVEYDTCKVYVSEPQNTTATAAASSSDAAIVIISDAFGWATPNMRLLADSYAERTSLPVYVPDFMEGA